MGNYNTRSVRFLQSQNDFPLLVSLGDKKPSCGLSRWKEKNSLRFLPSGDEGFAIRGDKRRLLYKGRRRSHRFTILNDGAFEYDCILLKEPESNVITLRMEGAELYDFFRQPYFVPDDFLKGSYAVYKKEMLVGEGTGKLCHIHRPLIIDALGRKVWGELSVVGIELRITIPEWWLSNAKYPVTVDPTIGTTTVGKQNYWEENEGDLHIEFGMIVNRFLISDALSGTQCTAYFYTDQHDGSAGGRPIVYSDNANSPLTRRSGNESFIDLRFINGNNKGWRSGNFSVNNVTAGSYIWFGLYSDEMWYPRYDFGAKCYWSGIEEYSGMPNTFPLWNVNYYFDYKLSMYFTYTSAQNYIRTLTQGIYLSDNGKITAEYKRTSSQTAQVSETRNLKTEYRRELKETQGIIDTFKQIRDYIRCLKIETAIIAETERSGEFYRTESDTVNVEGFSFRHLLIFIKLFSVSMVRDFILKRFLVSKEQIELKSLITRNINLESIIN